MPQFVLLHDRQVAASAVGLSPAMDVAVLAGDSGLQLMVRR
jgi:hypothetical protein